MGTSIRLTVNSDVLAEAFAQIGERTDDRHQLMDAIGAQLRSSTAERFISETDPDGHPWPQSIRAKLEGGQTLRDTGQLFDTLTYVADNDSVEVGTNRAFAEVHQFGATITAKNAGALRFRVGGHWVQKKSVTIPARPFLGINDDDRDAIADLATTWLAGLVGDAGGEAAGGPR